MQSGNSNRGADALGSSGPRRFALTAIVHNFAGGVLQAAISAAQSVLVLPMLLAQLSRATLGSWLSASEALFWVQSADLGLPQYFTSRAASLSTTGDRRVLAQLISACIVASSVLAFVVLSLALASASLLGSVLGGSSSSEVDVVALDRSFRLAAFGVGATVIANGVFGYAKGIQRTLLLNVGSVVAAAVSLATALMMLSAGYGVVAVGTSMLARGVTQMVFGIVFFVLEWGRLGGQFAWGNLRREIFGALRASRATFLGGIAFAVMQQSEISILAVVGSPSVAASYLIARKLVDLARMPGDILSFSVFGSLSYVASDNLPGAVSALCQRIRQIRLTLSGSALAGFSLVNASFVQLWTGEHVLGGGTMIVLVAVAALFSGESLLANFEVKAVVGIERGSMLMSLEALAKVLATGIGVSAFSFWAVPVAGSIASMCSIAYARGAVGAKLHSGHAGVKSSIAGLGWPLVLIFIAGSIGDRFSTSSWIILLIAFTAGVLLAAASFLVAYPDLKREPVLKFLFPGRG